MYDSIENQPVTSEYINVINNLGKLVTPNMVLSDADAALKKKIDVANTGIAKIIAKHKKSFDPKRIMAYIIQGKNCSEYGGSYSEIYRMNDLYAQFLMANMATINPETGAVDIPPPVDIEMYNVEISLQLLECLDYQLNHPDVHRLYAWFDDGSEILFSNINDNMTFFTKHETELLSSNKYLNFGDFVNSNTLKNLNQQFLLLYHNDIQYIEDFTSIVNYNLYSSWSLFVNLDFYNRIIITTIKDDLLLNNVNISSYSNDFLNQKRMIVLFFKEKYNNSDAIYDENYLLRFDLNNYNVTKSTIPPQPWDATPYLKPIPIELVDNRLNID